VELASSAPGALPDFSAMAMAGDGQNESAFDKPGQPLVGSPQAVPEPGAMGLLIVGALGILGLRRHLKRPTCT
jgi:hypothetical protein